MIFQHIGHSQFQITLDNGMHLMIDPYDEKCGYPIRNFYADYVLVSHHHHDHDAIHLVHEKPQVIDTTGVYTLCPGVSVSAILSDHDQQEGKERGKNLMFLIEAEGLRVAHLGDLGRILNKQEIAFLSPIDVLMIPVGGYYTIDAVQAKQVAELLQARIVLPMHYKTHFNESWPINSLESFTFLYSSDDIQKDGEALRVTVNDEGCHKKLVVF